MKVAAKSVVADDHIAMFHDRAAMLPVPIDKYIVRAGTRRNVTWLDIARGYVRRNDWSRDTEAEPYRNARAGKE